MSGIFSGMNMPFPLQTYFKEDDPVAAMILLISVGALIVIVLVVQLIRNGVSASVAGRGKTKVTPRKFNSFTLFRIASAYGLDKEQTKLLEYVFRNDAVSDPERVMGNPALLDRHFKRAYRTIEKNSETEDVAQTRLVRLFALRNTIDTANVGGSDSGKLSENTPAILVSGRDSFSVKILQSKGQSVVTEMPRNTLGTPVRLSKGTRITLSFFTKSSSGFSFDGHIVGAVNTDRGPGLQMTNTGKMKPLAKRRYRRRQADIHCEFYFVNIQETGSGRKKTSRLVVDNRRITGNVQDISVGGCSIKTSVPIQAGARLKINIDYDDNALITVLGQVIRTNKSGLSGIILHIKFLKVPRRAYNSISALVFGYDEN